MLREESCSDLAGVTMKNDPWREGMGGTSSTVVQTNIWDTFDLKLNILVCREHFFFILKVKTNFSE